MTDELPTKGKGPNSSKIFFKKKINRKLVTGRQHQEVRVSLTRFANSRVKRIFFYYPSDTFVNKAGEVH